MQRGDHKQACDVLRPLLLADATDVEVIFSYANAQAALSNFDEAISLLDTIAADHPEAGLAALGQAADWCMRCQRYAEAETKYQQIIDRMPQAAIARRQLAYLLNRQGRRHEAAEQIRVLCRLGDVREEELHALISLSDAIYDDPEREDALKPGSRPYWPIGLAGQARYDFTQHNYLKAAELLKQAIDSVDVPASIHAFYGRALAEAQQIQQLRMWIEAADPEIQQFAEYWAALGAYLIDQHRYEEAVRALGEAIRRDPTDSRSYRRMNQGLIALQKESEAQEWLDRYAFLNKVATSSNRIGAQAGPDFDAFVVLIEGLIKLNRPLEAVTWRIIEGYYRGISAEQLKTLNRQREMLASNEEAFGRAKDWLCGLRLEDYPMPNWTQAETDVRDKAARGIRNTLDQIVVSKPQPRFQNIARQVGLTHQFQVASEAQDRGFAIYQSFGGGVAALDYVLDGAVDLYFAQGGCDPPNYVGEKSNLLYRNTDGRLQDATVAAGAIEYRYSLGLTVGDWNQDGFPDLVVANLGVGTLLINNGDGTFARQDIDPLDDPTMLSTSLAVGDVDGDSLPDIIELNYLHDDTLGKRPSMNQQGVMQIVSPHDFTPAIDRVLMNDGLGGRIVRPIHESAEARSTGLGIVVANFDERSGNEIFVGNDVRPDCLWKQNGQGGWEDHAPTSGCSVGHGGDRTASMGIAAADFDASGTLDLLITNFQDRSNSFFVNRGSVFRERSIQYQLSADSMRVLGFGVQPIDYCNDSLMDIVITNGHVENTGILNQPFEQPTQLFANSGEHFKLMNVQDPSSYFASAHVGRALATLDFNQDGRTDFVVTHLGSPSALLINQTDSDYHWLDIKLVGKQCERDAIGATVKLRCGQRKQTQWVIGGDGYLCKNESRLHFGLGLSGHVDAITVTWPNGEQQQLKDIPADQSLLIVQGQQDWFELKR
ncbi:CRTAC1 family protein [Rhodopirellula baltica]